MFSYITVPQAYSQVMMFLTKTIIDILFSSNMIRHVALVDGVLESINVSGCLKCLREQYEEHQFSVQSVFRRHNLSVDT